MYLCMVCSVFLCTCCEVPSVSCVLSWTFCTHCSCFTWACDGFGKQQSLIEGLPCGKRRRISMAGLYTCDMMCEGWQQLVFGMFGRVVALHCLCFWRQGSKFVFYTGTIAIYSQALMPLPYSVICVFIGKVCVSHLLGILASKRCTQTCAVSL